MSYKIDSGAAAILIIPICTSIIGVYASNPSFAFLNKSLAGNIERPSDSSGSYESYMTKCLNTKYS
tara:strand:+ start:71759 stop:71956 length:198 start_codon:yes stop_codon:yes gene_type:complete